MKILMTSSSYTQFHTTNTPHHHTHTMQIPAPHLQNIQSYSIILHHINFRIPPHSTTPSQRDTSAEYTSVLGI